jgi:choline monooxygenase
VVRPLGVDRTKVSFLTYVWDETKLDAGAGAGLDRVEREDEAVVEAVQRGVRSRRYDRGRYSPTREQGVHHFHRLLAEVAFGA